MIDATCQYPCIIVSPQFKPPPMWQLMSVVLRIKGTIPMYICVASIQTTTDVAADECGLAKKGDLFEFQRFYSNHHRVVEELKHRRVK